MGKKLSFFSFTEDVGVGTRTVKGYDADFGVLLVEAGLGLGFCHFVGPAHLGHQLLEEADLAVGDINRNCRHNVKYL